MSRILLCFYQRTYTNASFVAVTGPFRVFPLIMIGYICSLATQSLLFSWLEETANRLLKNIPDNYNYIETNVIFTLLLQTFPSVPNIYS